MIDQWVWMLDCAIVVVKMSIQMEMQIKSQLLLAKVRLGDDWWLENLKWKLSADRAAEETAFPCWSDSFQTHLTQSQSG